MNNLSHQLDYVLNIEKFQSIQDNIARATGMSVIAIDLVGHPITEHSLCSAFCRTVRDNPELSHLCERCDSHGGLEAARNQQPYIYRCHFGIVDFAIPIIANGQYLGAIMAGQIRLPETEHSRLNLIIGEPHRPKINEYPELRALYDSLAVMSMEKIESVAQMINHLVNYIVGEAVLKTSLYEINQQLTEFTKDSIKQSHTLQNRTHLYYSVEQKPEPVEVEPDEPPLLRAHKSSLLYPALEFINEHFRQKIYLDEMAYLCNISPSYFSKIFKREMGLNFSAYINQVKLSEAKRMLETTEEPIVNISLDLGFDDCGYFIKVFKKQVGRTPASYRKRFLQQRAAEP
ncbi:PocR ligand-binding domain-containing protein [Reinekea marinisedimentorum]|uniref:Ligand-binding sensor protein n=1 Tax=Reinekea marinisedimentorum TaxID=230495 RepID=A0A4R3IEE8_9GAMM|nr:PocR ligand-binding domain-containing protein [Reinekea marinisedimentorum]TCS43161.1 ligand-binding sensor protein [Reinekea marinisedimentorum]